MLQDSSGAASEQRTEMEVRRAKSVWRARRAVRRPRGAFWMSMRMEVALGVMMELAVSRPAFL